MKAVGRDTCQPLPGRSVFYTHPSDVTQQLPECVCVCQVFPGIRPGTVIAVKLKARVHVRMSKTHVLVCVL